VDVALFGEGASGHLLNASLLLLVIPIGVSFALELMIGLLIFVLLAVGQAGLLDALELNLVLLLLLSLPLGDLDGLLAVDLDQLLPALVGEEHEQEGEDDVEDEVRE